MVVLHQVVQLLAVLAAQIVAVVVARLAIFNLSAVLAVQA
jgi:hypothetical protein